MFISCRVIRLFFFFSSRRRHTRLQGDWSSDVCSSDLRGIAFYCASDHYLHIADICGLGTDARTVKVAWEERDFDRATELVSDALLDKFSLVGTPEKNAARIQWLFDNSVYPIVYPLPRRERMLEDHHNVLQQASRWAQ